MSNLESKDQLLWKVNAAALIKEIAENGGPAMSGVIMPLHIFRHILSMVAVRASQLNDPEMNKLMCRLALYAISDPYSGEYDAEALKQVMEA